MAITKTNKQENQCYQEYEDGLSLVAKTPYSQCRGPKFDPWQGTRPHMPQYKMTQHREINQ